ncbi:MAG: hypothetical protein A2008_03905 [Candidatus Wallbacteria bacterium GWC2_49_35]|uniref:Aldehyde ferredoxin oxidoreductase N-terminal domain-containing protein n=1 Tax=Candidatus Wallbacteria bacterium GWC2_49_35 TaxID=1817813 RepID=A0A1F7WUI7_9BACT|nr:MAG: hypothetical protein A2008_03905 [Candidatus Wallbacteria bacterium GWC2_49_35]HBC76711.1 aldehyde ferredoxin oxidoreductase [Candidatus Wallbacteria bacterium]
MIYAYNGRIMQIDLTMQSCREILIDPADVRTHLLGSGYAAAYFLKNLNYGADPLSPAAPLFILAGLVTGTPFLTACKMSVCGRSPLTGIWNESTVGGHFAHMLKCSGYDGIILTGRSKSPIYLLIDEGKVDFRDASHLWGRDTFYSDSQIRSETNDLAKVMCIGPAGEKQVKIASIICEGKNARTAGRGGMGAVFGSKNLKAVAVFGSKKMQVADYGALIEELKKTTLSVKEKSSQFHEFGTAGGLKNSELLGNLPVKNWAEGNFSEYAGDVSGQNLVRLTSAKHYYCYSCPIGCAKIMDFSHPAYGAIQSHMPEYEGAAGFSSLILNRDPYLVCAACEYCDRAGIDTISASSAVAFAMECYEHGLVSREDAGGLELKWGSADAVMGLLEQMAARRELGGLLGEGTRAAAAVIGGLAPEFAVHVKGLEVAMHDPRAFYAMAANYMTANRGACHLESLAYTLGYGRRYEGLGLPEQFVNDSASAALACVITQNFFGLFNPLGICKFVARAAFSINEIARWLEITAGLSYTPAELLRAGERIFNEKRVINVKLGISRKDDILPPRLISKKRGSGRAADNLADVGLILSEYYSLRGWDEFGVPTDRKLDELGIDFRP